MTSENLPSVFAMLREDPNPAVDAALVEALPSVAPFVQAAALELLIRRGDVPALASIVAAFPSFEGTLAELVAARAGEFAAGIRAAVSAPLPDTRCAAAALIARGRAFELAYLLTGALRLEDRATRSAAADALLQLTTQYFAAEAEDIPAPAAGRYENRVAQLAEAVTEAMRLWDLHHEWAVLRAAANLEDRAIAGLTAALNGTKAALPRMLGDAMERHANAWIAPLMLRGLAMPEVRAAAARGLTRCEDLAFLADVLRNAWLVADPAIEKACRRLQPGPWVDRAVSVLAEADAPTASQGVRLLLAMGGTVDQRLSALRKIIDAPGDALRRAAVWALVQDDSETSTELLRVVASRAGYAGAVIATRELRRRARRTGAGPEPAAGADDRISSAVQGAFAQFWIAQDEPNATPLADRFPALKEHRAEAQSLARRRMGSAEPLDRVKALRLIGCLGWTRDLSDVVERAVSDPHALVRGAAVAMLVDLPGPMTERRLRDALRDPDDRVQANAIEAMDRLDIPSRGPLTQMKLSARSGRVRANAIKSLLRLELRAAAEALVQMLDAADASHRMSALWVVEHFGSRALWERIATMSRFDADPRVRNRAKRILRALGGARVAAPAHRADTGPAESRAR